MIGTKLNKPIEDFATYAELAKWCQSNGAIITDKGEYYECAALEITLDALKAEKLAQFKCQRDAEEVTNIIYNGNPFDYDQKSRERLHIARQALQDSGNAAASIVWTTADNKRVLMTVKDFAALNAIAAGRSNTLHTKYNALKERIESAGSVEEVEAVKWTTE